MQPSITLYKWIRNAIYLKRKKKKIKIGTRVIISLCACSIIVIWDSITDVIVVN